MKKKIVFITTVLIGLSFTGISQDEEKSNTLDAQFKDLIDNSNNYQSYKVIEQSKLLKLKKNINDTISLLEESINENEIVIQEQKVKIDSSLQEVETLRADLTETQEKVDSIDFLGVSTQKSMYTIIMWSIIGVLFLLALIMFFVFKKGQKNTRDARDKLVETQVELETLRKRSMEREQKVRRELQDELNKNMRRD